VAIDLFKVIEPRDQFVELVAGLHLLDAAFHFLDAFRDHAAVNGLDRLGDVSQHGETFGRYFGETAQHYDLLCAARAMHSKNSGPQRSDERRVTHQNAEITFGAGYVDLLDFTREHQLFR
jgi:hypothetical protein